MAQQHQKKAPVRGNIRPRGNSLQVRVYAGANPETGKPHYLTETHTDPKEAEKARTRLVALADARKAPLSNNTFAVAVRQWLDSRQAEVDADERRPCHQEVQTEFPRATAPPIPMPRRASFVPRPPGGITPATTEAGSPLLSKALSPRGRTRPRRQRQAHPSSRSTRLCARIPRHRRRPHELEPPSRSRTPPSSDLSGPLGP